MSPSPPPSARSGLAMQSVDWLMLAVLGLLWGGSYFFAKVAVEDIPPLTVVFARVLIAAGLLTVLIRAWGLTFPTTWAEWKPLVVMGALNSAVPYTLIFWGETRIASGLAAILTATVPIFTVLVAHFWTTDERITPARAAGIGLGMTGVLVIMRGDLGDITSGSGLAKLAIIGAAVAYAISGVYGRRLAGRPPLVLAWGQMCAATLFMIPFVVLVDQPWNITIWHLDAVLSVLALAMFSTSLAYLIFFRLLARVGATNTSLVTFLIPISSLLLGGLFLGEHLVVEQVVGMVLIAGGMLIIDGRLWHRVNRHHHPTAVAPGR